MSTSAIEWTEQTWNPVVGCTKVSPGCKHCYAETMHQRLNAMNAKGYEQPFNTVRVMDKTRMEQPIHRKKPTMYFVNSMSDLFHDNLSDYAIDKVMTTIRKSPQHTFQVLTKRSGRMDAYFNQGQHCGRLAPDNAWIGVSVENREYGLPRLIDLQGIPAKTRFLSCEPLLGDLGELNLTGIHWVICGGESGAKARPMNPQWARNLRDQCIQQGVPFFFKQWGSHGEDGIKRNKKANGRLLDGQLWDQMPTIETA